MSLEIIFQEVNSFLPSNCFIIIIRIVAALAVSYFVIKALAQRFLFREKKTEFVYRTSPCPKGYPIIGISHILLTGLLKATHVPPLVWFLYTIVGILHIYDDKNIGLFDGTYAGHRFVSLHKPETVEALLSSNHFIEKSTFYDFFKPWLGNGLLLNKGDNWRRARKTLTSAFHFKILDAFQPVMYEKSKTLVDVLSENGSDFQSIKTPIDLYTVDVISCTAMGVDLDCQRDAQNPFVVALKRMTVLVMSRIINPMTWIEFIYKRTKQGKEFYSHLNTINKFVAKMIQNRREKLEKENINGNFNMENIKGQVPFLDMLLLQHLTDPDSLTEENMKDEVHTFMFGGQDTTASALVWCLFLLGNYHEEQELLYDEVISVLGEDLNKDITNADLKRMTYLDCVLKESQRIFPSVPCIARQIKDDMVIEGCLIRKNSTVVVYNYALHHNSNVYSDPEKFIPTRFTPENSKGRHPFAFVPFSAGPRNCVGQRFALLEEKTVVANIIRHFRIVSKDKVDKVPYCPEIVSRPAVDIKMKFIPRNS